MTSGIPVVTTTRPAPGPALQAVLLDMDGTLVDTEGFWWQVEVAVFAELGHQLLEEYREIVAGGPMTRCADFLIKATGAKIAVAELTALLNVRFSEMLGQGVPLMPGARRLLAELAAHRVPTALVSASHRHIIERVLPALGPANFTLTISGDETERNKPHPDPYLLAASRLGAEPARCAVIEDSLTGVAAAEAAGCPVVAVPSVSAIPPAAGRTVVRSLEQVDLGFLRALIWA
ncbi:HAD family hydrolase [Streptomyces sp. NPDC052396]|uniref:HAD family hydrolase n=1 Tax=Streptomyces sp. NPDC052396 TaxID=3365689 RepID=UPI0037D91CB5